MLASVSFAVVAKPGVAKPGVAPKAAKPTAVSKSHTGDIALKSGSVEMNGAARISLTSTNFRKPSLK